MYRDFAPFETSMKNFEKKLVCFWTFVNLVRMPFSPGAKAFLRVAKIAKKSS